MSATKRVTSIITFLLNMKNKSIKGLAEHQNMQEQSMRNKLTRANYKVEDLIEFAEYIGVEVGFKDGDNFYSFLESKKNKQ